MAYGLGIDIGTTFTAAAVSRAGRIETVELGDRAAAVPSVLYLGADGSVQVGEAANRRALQDPGRVAREFKRRVGDPAPVIVGGSPYSADGLVAKLLAWVVASVTAREGGRPSAIALTHPANWGPYKRDLMRQAAERAGLGKEVTLLSEPEAAAACYAATERVDVGTTVAVYDLGGGTFDAAVLRKTASGFDILGSPQGIERLGGVDFDEAVFAHVQAAMGDAFDKLDPTDPATVAAVARLRAECVAAKETLSADTEAAIAVMLPGTHTTVRLVRGEFEDMIRPAITETVSALRRAVSVAGLTPAGINAVVLVGGSSRIPLVTQLVSDELARPIATDVHPTNAVAIGAAHSTARRPTGVAPARVGVAPAAARTPAARAADAPAARAPASRAPAARTPRTPPAGAPTARPGPAIPPAGRPARPAASGRPTSSPARPLASSGPTPRPATPPVPKVTPAAARPPRTLYLPDEPMPTVNPRRPRPTSGSVQGRRALRFALIIIAIAAVLLLAWWGLSYVNKANVAAPVAEIPRSGTVTTTAAASAKNTVAVLAQTPCKALTNAQATTLGVQSPGQEGPAQLCSWSGKGIPGVTVAAASGFDSYQNSIDNKAGYTHFEFIEVSNRKSTQFGLDGSCSVTVRVSANESITAGSSGPASDQQNPHGCTKAKATAAAVLANF